MNLNFIPKHKLVISMFVALMLLNGCSSKSTAYKSQTTRTSSQSVSTSQTPAIERLDSNCHSHVVERENSMGGSGEAAQQIALAKAATRCIKNKSFYPQHPDKQVAMQLNALAVVNYIKAGESQQAMQSLAAFRANFPQQDLLFSDYTSFVDTAVALLKHNDLSTRQLQVLNINAALRDELKRQQYWLRN